jgi:hypothetical protein
MWLALALALGGAQLGCDEPPTVEEPGKDSDQDGVPDSEDCDDSSRLAWRWVQAFPDEDRDGHGAGTLKSYCAGDKPPANTATTADDCAPQDITRWRRVEGLYYTDADRDGTVSATPAGTCLGPDAAAYTLSQGTDCDDADARVWRLLSLYTDGDKDGYAGGAAEPRCIGALLPSGYFETSQDCAPTDPARYQLLSYSYRDADGDGVTVYAPGQVCTSSLLPSGYATTSSGASDCDDTRADRTHTTGLYPDTDGDGVGSGFLEQRCLGAGSTSEPGYAKTPGDCAPDDRTSWARLYYTWRDADGDRAWVSQEGDMCIGSYTLPAGYSASRPAVTTDCDDTNATASVSWTVFPDTDNDGVGAGSSVTLCAGLTRPAGYAATGGDCAPDDGSRWQNLTYQYRDADGDTFTVASSGSLCTSGGGLPAGYTNTAKGNDCDDTSADVYQGLQGYPDEDGDGVGAGTAATFCTSGALPPGQSPQGDDCAPSDARSWQRLSYQYVDADGDGRTVPSSGAVCTGSTLPLPYLTRATGNDCDDADAARFLWRVLYPDKDGDGVGVPPRVVLCLDDGPAPPGYSIYGFDPDDSKPGVTFPPEDPALEVLLLDG